MLRSREPSPGTGKGWRTRPLWTTAADSDLCRVASDGAEGEMADVPDAETEAETEADADAGLSASWLLEDSGPGPGPGPDVGRWARGSVSERDWHTKPLLLQKRQGGSEVMTHAVLRRRQASQGLFLRLRGWRALPKLLRMLNLRGVAVDEEEVARSRSSLASACE